MECELKKAVTIVPAKETGFPWLYKNMTCRTWEISPVFNPSHFEKD